MTQKAIMDSDLIDWKEAFLFFYWDIKQLRENRPKEGYIADRLIMEFFQQTRPSMAYEGPARNWNWTLYRAMRALQVQLGFDTGPETTAFSYEWLGEKSGPTDTKAPFVDWVRLETQTHLLFTYANNTVNRFLAHLVTEVYGPLSQRKDWELQNPFLTEFQRTHNVQPWGVPLPLPGASEALDQIEWPDAPILASKSGFTHSRRKPIRFSISVASTNKESNHVMPTATLMLPEESLLNARLFNLTKRYYTAMLLWVKGIRDNDGLPSLSDLLNAQFCDWAKAADEGSDESLVVSRHLWEAYRAVGSKPIGMKSALTDKEPKKTHVFTNGGCFRGF
ncbi:uncharacterized protein ColSpa_01989 [Colletotrichum spaethianum]|uniref:Uncharacterized protein n=1 Tax=Colletotrichum spaethianum TaxID=700344 RepID=A0AA37L8V2_9PEZI|nr:uncharacterized protein ColSpa_01989 [Colletotrichum spaethianum]GKT41808.1 hypothetical protein ColSpa_01989 [Colletotrichum spaethianum]